MEQKRTLWIIAAVGVFLLVVLGAALILYSPKATSGQIASGHNSTKTNDSGWISLAPAQNNEVSSNQGKENPFERTRPLPPVEEKRDELSSVDSNRTVQYEQNQVASRENSVTHVGELTVYADKATFYTNTPSGEGNAVPQTVINNTTTIDLTGSQHPVVVPPKTQSEVRQNQKPAQVASAQVQYKNAEKPAPAAVKKAEPAKTVTNASKPASKPAVQSAPKANEKIQYWVQVTSLTSRKNADNARDVLGENKIPADVFTYTDSNNRLFYRVRVGPYTTKAEAEYWKGRINEINEFKASQSYVASTKVSS